MNVSSFKAEKRDMKVSPCNLAGGWPLAQDREDDDIFLCYNIFASLGRFGRHARQTGVPVRSVVFLTRECFLTFVS
jgi:hypothetical protein